MPLSAALPSGDSDVERLVPQSNERKIKELERLYLIPGAQKISSMAEIVVSRAQGTRIWDLNGQEYIDFFAGAGVSGIGHSHPHFITRVIQQLEHHIVGSFSTEVRAEYLGLLSRQLPENMRRVQLYSGGTEAVEAAMRLAKAATGKFEVLGFWGGYHGKTLGSLSVTSGAAKKGWGPIAPGFHQVPYADCYRCSFGLDYPGCSMRCVSFIEEYLDNNSVGSLAAIIIEPIQGTNGNVAPPREFLEGVADIAKRNEALLIFDEIITGLGRTGRMFAFEHLDPSVHPDIVILGKAIASGIPMSAIVAKKDVAEGNLFARPSASSSSYGGNPLACAAAMATLEVILSENLLDNVRTLEEVFLRETRDWISKYPFVGKIHCRGLMIGIELVGNRLTREPLPQQVTHEIFYQLLQRGMLAMAYNHRIRLYPPLSTSEALFEIGLSIFEEVFASVASTTT